MSWKLQRWGNTQRIFPEYCVPAGFSGTIWSGLSLEGATRVALSKECPSSVVNIPQRSSILRISRPANLLKMNFCTDAVQKILTAIVENLHYKAWYCRTPILVEYLLMSTLKSFIFFLKIKYFWLESNRFFYCAMTICIPFILLKSNRVWFEKCELRIFFVL